MKWCWCFTIYQSQSAWATIIDSRRPIGWEGAVNWGDLKPNILHCHMMGAEWDRKSAVVMSVVTINEGNKYNLADRRAVDRIGVFDVLKVIIGGGDD